MTSITPAARPAQPRPHRCPRTGPGPVASQPAPEAAARIIRALREHPCWSAFWDKHTGVWRVAEDDPDSGLYAESSDAGTVIAYIQANS
jgi:hypothetical protein